MEYEQYEESPETEFLDNTPSKRVQIGNRIMYFNFNFPSSLRGLLKVIQICVCFLAMLLVGFSQPVHDERGLAFAATFTGLTIAFMLLVAYTCMLNTKLDATCWLYSETIYNIIMVVIFIVAAIFMFLFNANYWADRNPDWQVVPALSSGALFACAVVYAWDAIVLIYGWQRYSWKPTEIYGHKQSVLPQ